jgi:hypothetical protein
VRPGTSGKRLPHRQVRLEMRGIDNDQIGFSDFARKFGEDAAEHAQTAPQAEAFIYSFMRPSHLGRIMPHQSLLDDVDDRRVNPPIIKLGNFI